MSELTTRLDLPLIAASQAQKHVPVNEALTRLDSLVQLSVLGRTLAEPPAAPGDGDRFIVAASATGAWSGHDDEVAAYDGGWIFLSPAEGWFAWDAGAQELLIFTDGSWTPFAGGGGGSGDLQNVPLFGLGSEADSSNPFSAKLNNVLWTALASGEGGSGDLRYVMNKEASGNVLSLLLQSGYGGRAEIGLVGDDDLLVKVSGDGALWREAIRIDKSTGRATFPSGGAREQLTANRTYFVRTDGSDSNDGLVDNAGGAFLTVQKAVDTVYALDLSVFDVTIKVADGTYTNSVVLSGAWIGKGVVTIEGNLAAPANCLFSITGNNAISLSAGARLSINGIGLQTASSGSSVFVETASELRIGSAVDFGAAAYRQIHARSGGAVIASSYTISAGASCHVILDSGGHYFAASGTIVLTGSPAFGTAIFKADSTSTMSIYSMSFSGSAVGKRFEATLNGVINTFGSGTSFLPGSLAGTTSTGGQYA